MLLISKTYWLGMPFNYKGSLPAATEVRPLHLQAATCAGSPAFTTRPPTPRSAAASACW